MTRVRILDLDGSLVPQREVFANEPYEWISGTDWGPRIRLACTFREYHRFRTWLAHSLIEQGPAITFYGSGDFHHVTLALLERIPCPFNLLVLDKHPDWMRGIPFLHCGSWLRHALRLPNLNRVFHCGGETDFDNAYRLLAPWEELRSRRVVVFPARRAFRRGRWKRVSTYPLAADTCLVEETLAKFVDPSREELGRLPLYVSIDKDVLSAAEAAVNWDSGLMLLADALTVLETFLSAAGGQLAGADVLGDWSPIVMGTSLNRLCHRLDHPSPIHDPQAATERNGRANGEFLRRLGSVSAGCSQSTSLRHPRFK